MTARLLRTGGDASSGVMICCVTISCSNLFLYLLYLARLQPNGHDNWHNELGQE